MTLSSFYHGSQPCPEPLKPKSQLQRLVNTNQGWSSITMKTPSPVLPPPPETEVQKTTTPPTRSYFSFKKLTQHSLDICTEILGSETGKGDIFPGDLEGLTTKPCSSATVTTTTTTTTTSTATTAATTTNCTERFWTKRVVVGESGGVPPILSSMAGGNSVRVTRCMEDGRLVLRATIQPSSFSFLTTQRTKDSCGNGDGPRLSIVSVANFEKHCNGGLCSRLVIRYRPLQPCPEVEEEEEEVNIGVEIEEYEKRRRRLSSSGCQEEAAAAVAAAVAVSGGVRRYRGDGHNAIRCYSTEMTQKQLQLYFATDMLYGTSLLHL